MNLNNLQGFEIERKEEGNIVEVPVTEKKCKAVLFGRQACVHDSAQSASHGFDPTASYGSRSSSEGERSNSGENGSATSEV